jgi:hypothetical protein
VVTSTRQPAARPDQETAPVRKADLRRELRPLYRAGREPAFVTVPPLWCLMLDGHGDPNTAPAYREAISALYSTAYAAKFALKRAGVVDYGVMPLEGLWWSPDMAAFAAQDTSAWDWTMFIVQPREVTAGVFAEARDAARSRAPSEALDHLRLEDFAEGRCAQILHVGPYSAEGPTIATLHAYIADHGYRLSGKHHEIYLGDPRRAAPERLRTIIRQPVAPA